MSLSNTFEAYLRTETESETLLINQISLLRASKNEEVFKFGFGQSPFPVPNKITNALANAAHRKEYMSVQGDPELRQAIVNFHNQMEGRNFHADNIIVGAGSKILIFNIMAAFKQAEIILPAPSWVSYQPQAHILGHPVDWISTNFEDKWSLTPASLDEFCKNRSNPDIPLILVLNYPNNPSGQTLDTTQLKALASVMQKHKVIVIADEIYSLLIYKDKQASICDYYPEGCIVTSGLSKWCGAGGWRLGFAHIPPELGKHLFQAIIGTASETYSCASSPIQIAATTAYEEFELAKTFIDQQTKLLSFISEYCTSKLNNAGVKVHPCEGGFYVFPDFSAHTKKLNNRNICSSKELTTALMDETGVALLPGSAFGMPKESLTARLAFVDFDGAQIFNTSVQQANIEKIKKGITKLCDWVNNL